MNRIQKKLKEDKKILSVYFTAGFPRLDDTKKIISRLEKHNVDLIEVGIPFSDPLADGETIQKSSKKAIENGSLLMLEQGHCLRSHILQNNDISNRHISNFSCTSISTLVAMVDMNIGVSFLPKMAIDYGTLDKYPNISIDMDMDSSKTKRDIGVIYRKNNPQKENIKKLAQLLVKN